MRINNSLVPKGLSVATDRVLSIGQKEQTMYVNN